MADVMAAEREASGGSYQGSRARASPLGPRVGSNWTEEVEKAISELGKGDDYSLIIIVRLASNCCSIKYLTIIRQSIQRPKCWC